jgi:hypothetical protein
MIGSYTFLWKLISNTLHYHSGKISKTNGFIAGAVASSAMLFETKENRIGYAQQFFMRAMQAGKNALKYRNIWTVPHGDTILFCFSCASILYAYAYKPHTIPKEYYRWMIGKAQVPKACLIEHAKHKNAQDLLGTMAKVNIESLSSALDGERITMQNREKVFGYIKNHGGAMPGTPCGIFHRILEFI